MKNLILIFLFSIFSFSVFSQENELTEDVENVVDVIFKYKLDDVSNLLHTACFYQDVKSVEILLNYGVDPYLEKNYGNLANAACKTNSMGMIKYLIEERGVLPSQNPFPSLISQRPPFYEAIDYLLQIGFEFQESIFIDASSYGYPLCDDHIDLIHFLFERNASIGFLKDPTHQNSCKSILEKFFLLKEGERGKEVTRLNKNENAKRLLDFFLNIGLDLNQKISFVRSENAHYKQHLLSHTHWQFVEYNTPLLISISNGDIELVKYLIKHKADPNMIGDERVLDYRNQKLVDAKISPLQLAINFGFKEIVSKLIANGAKI